MLIEEARYKSKSGIIKYDSRRASLNANGSFYWINKKGKAMTLVSYSFIQARDWQPYEEPECGCDSCIDIEKIKQKYRHNFEDDSLVSKLMLYIQYYNCLMRSKS